MKSINRIAVRVIQASLVGLALAAQPLMAQDPPDFALDGDSFSFTSGAYDGKLGGTCWFDADKDGLQSTDTQVERGYEGVLVELLDSSNQSIATTYTDGSGFYVFDRLDAGNYRVKVTQPEGCRLSPPNVDGNNQDTRDSDFNESTATTDLLEINAAQSMNFSVDAGLICNEEPEFVTKAVDDTLVVDAAGAAILPVLDNDILHSPLTELKLLSSDTPDAVEVVNNTLVMRSATTPGSYQIRYQILCADGTISEASVNLTLDFPPPLPVLTARDDIIIMKIGESVSLDVMENDVITTDFSEINILSSNVPASVTYRDEHRKIVPLQVRAPTAEGHYQIEYELIGTGKAQVSRAYVHVIIEPNTTLNLAPPAFVTPDGIVGCPQHFENKEGQAVDVYLVFPRWNHAIQKMGTIPAGERRTFEMPSYFHVRTPEWDFAILVPAGEPPSWSNMLQNYLPYSCNSTLSGHLIDPPPRVVPATDPITIYGCTVYDESFSLEWNRRVFIAERSMTDWADSYKFYDQHGNHFQTVSGGSDATPIYRTIKRETYQWGHDFAAVTLESTTQLVYYVSRVVNGIESPALACYHNPWYTTPIALDLNTDGKVERLKGKFTFDFNGDGELETVGEWFGPQEGILIDRRVGDHISGQHLFGDLGGRFADGYHRLQQLDTNQDGYIQGDELVNLGVWIDANSNARLDTGEVQPLSTIGVTRLNTQHNGDYLSHAFLKNGRRLLMEDVFFPPYFGSRL